MTAAASPCQGQTPFDVADEGLAEHLEALQKRQGVVSLRGGRAVCLPASRQWPLFLQELSTVR